MREKARHAFAFPPSGGRPRYPSVEHRGGLDAFLLKARDEELSLKARRLKREIARARAAGAEQSAA